MNRSNKYKFNEISNLRLIDFKAQKKTIPFKRFCRIPLSYEETLKENFEAAANVETFQKKQRNMSGFAPKRNKSKIHRRLINTSSSKAFQYPDQQMQVKDHKILKILKNCNRLLNTGSGFKWKFNRFEKGSKRCLEQIKQKLDFLLTAEGGNWNLN